MINFFSGERVAQGWATLEKQAKQKCAAPRQAKHGMRSVAGETLLEVGSADMQRQIGSKTE